MTGDRTPPREVAKQPNSLHKVSSQPEPISAVRVRVPAKLNLALHVGPVRADGYHPLNTVFQAVSLFDEVTAEAADPGVVTVRMSGVEVPGLSAADNLAVRAARLLIAEYQVAEGCHLSIRKSIPVAGGMAGGSGNAAAALLACSVLWDLDVSPEEMRSLGAKLGSDVPFALMGGTAIGSGRGDELVPLLVRGSFHWVLVFDDRGLATPQVYRRFDELAEVTELAELADDMLRALGAGDVAALGGYLCNDLAGAACDLHPELATTLAVGMQAGAVAGLVSGSGPTCAFLAADESAAVDLSNRLTAQGYRARRVASPVPGARILY